jgi:(R)-amidase
VTSSVRVLLVQLAPHRHDPESNVAVACGLLDEHPDADLAVFPELYLQSYALKDLTALDLDSTPSPVEPLLAAARRQRTAVLVGVAERLGDTMANTALCIDEDGGVAARYRKVQLFGAESRYFCPGDEYVVVTLAGARVGPLVCYDLEFPEPARALATAGAQLLVTLSANMDPYAEDHALFLRVRALENGIPHVYVNCVGEEGRLTFCGGSAVADENGRVVTQLPSYRPDVHIADVQLGPVREKRTPDYLADLRRDVRVSAGLPPAMQSG